jgi:leucyl/phenylalanyl-tRNA--protein transferase
MLRTMRLTWLNPDSLSFPPTALALDEHSDAPGLLAAGGDLRPERLINAYSQGIYPWYAEGQPIVWWSPSPRMVLHTAEFKLSRSLRKTLQRFCATPGCEIQLNSAFPQVIAACAGAPREGQNGTWILPEMRAAYERLNTQGVAHSVETWVDGELVGGLYGLKLGRMFFGESMFMRRTDASKIALAALVALCREHGITMIDCQQQTRHLASLGARPIRRALFEAHLAATVDLPAPAEWAWRGALWERVLGVPTSTTDGANTENAPSP